LEKTSLTYALCAQTETNETKAWFRGFFYVIQPGNGLGLFNSCLGLNGRARPENFAGYYEEVHSSLISETMLDNLKHQMHEYVSCTP